MSKSTFGSLEFHEINFTKKDLKKIPSELLSFVVSSSIAANELAMFTRLLILHSHEDASHEITRKASTNNYIMILRNYGAKLIEFIKIFEDLSKSCRRSGLDTKIDLDQIDFAVKCYKEDLEYILAKKIRNWSTNHYVGTSLLQNIDKFNDDHIFSMILHRYTGNTIYFAGEEIGNLGFFSFDDKNGITFGQMAEWSIKVAENFGRYNQQIMRYIFSEYLPNNTGKRRVVPVETELLADMPICRSPIFAKLIPPEAIK